MPAFRTLRSLAVPIARLVAATPLIALAAAPAFAQRQTPREAVRDLLPGSSSTEVSAVAQAVLMQISSVPIGSSSGSFTFLRNELTGEASLKAFSFGPSFAERPTTLGKPGAVTLGATYQRTTFRTFEGAPLRGGLRAEVRLDGRPVGELFSASLDVSTASTTLVGTVAVTRDLDVAVSVPFVQLSLAGTTTTAPTSTGGGVVSRDVATSGFGDMQVRAKWAPLQSDRGGAAIAFEARLPTGNQDALIGSPGIRPRLLFLGSTTAGAVSPHVNVSYQFGGDGAVVDRVAGGLDELIEARLGREFGYTVGAEIAAHPRLTLSVDLLGRSLRNAARFRFEEREVAPGQSSPEVRATLAQLSQMGRARLYSLTPHVGSLNRWLLAVGAKTAFMGRGLVRVDVLGSLNDAGLKPGLTTVLGMEYAF